MGRETGERRRRRWRRQGWDKGSQLAATVYLHIPGGSCAQKVDRQSIGRRALLHYRAWLTKRPFNWYLSFIFFNNTFWNTLFFSHFMSCEEKFNCCKLQLSNWYGNVQKATENFTTLQGRCAKLTTARVLRSKTLFWVKATRNQNFFAWSS